MCFFVFWEYYEYNCSAKAATVDYLNKLKSKLVLLAMTYFICQNNPFSLRRRWAPLSNLGQKICHSQNWNGISRVPSTEQSELVTKINRNWKKNWVDRNPWGKNMKEIEKIREAKTWKKSKRSARQKDLIKSNRALKVKKRGGKRHSSYQDSVLTFRVPSTKLQ